MEPQARAYALPLIVVRWKRCWSNGQKGSRELLCELCRCPSAVFDLKSYWLEPRVAHFPFVQMSGEERLVLEEAEQSRSRFYHLEEEDEGDETDEFDEYLREVLEETE